jgi:Dolichyl-phosphate-mannose-protein mannosyltransferase
MIDWLRKHPASLLLGIQGFLYFWKLNLLSPWMDEVTTLRLVRLPVREMLHATARDVHPPLYYFLVSLWQHVPLGLSQATQARVLSVLFALAATVAVDRLWARRLPEMGRFWFLLLWTFSPCLLLYSRMCRSYSLQILVTVLAAAALRRFLEERSQRAATFMVIGVAAALYTHYVPGLAILAAANIALLRKRRLRDALAVDGLSLLLYLPWLRWLGQAVERWGGHPQFYSATGTSLIEIPVKLAYWAMSASVGESLPDAAVVAGGLLLPLVVWLMIGGARRQHDLAWMAVPAVVIGLIGVAWWVSYPFLPARMLFAFPLLLLLFAAGTAARPRLGALTAAALLILSTLGIECYFLKTGFRNKEYPMPMAEIAAYIQSHSTDSDSALLVDNTNCDVAALEYALGDSRVVLETGDHLVPAILDARLADPRVHTVWFLRNLHDISVLQLDDLFEKRLRPAMTPRAHRYQPFSALEIRAMRWGGMAHPPEWFQELLEFRR